MHYTWGMERDWYETKHHYEPLAEWEQELLYGPTETQPARLPEGVGNVTVTHTDGSHSRYERIRYDANRMENGFLVMENDGGFDARIFHVCNPQSWEVDYDA